MSEGFERQKQEDEAFCFSCGAIIKKEAEICPECGVRQFADPPYPAAEEAVTVKTQAVSNADTPDLQADPDDAKRNKAMAVLAYILFFIPIITGRHKKSPFVKHHTNQGTLLSLAFLAVIITANLSILAFTLIDNLAEMAVIKFTVMTAIVMGIALLYLAVLVFCIIGMIKGIINAAAGKMKPLLAPVLLASPFVCALVATLLAVINFNAQSPLAVNYTDLNVKLFRVMDIVPQLQQKERSDLTFNIYDDDFASGLTLKYIGTQQLIDLYYIPSAEGKYAIHWGNITRNNGFNISLFIGRDLNYLTQNGYVLEFKVKTEKPASFDVKFINFQDNIRWQNGYPIKLLQPVDWQTIRIPLRDFQFWGGEDNTTGRWVQPRGSISWIKITGLEFIATHEDDTRKDIYLDDIKITK